MKNKMMTKIDVEKNSNHSQQPHKSKNWQKIGLKATKTSEEKEQGIPKMTTTKKRLLRPLSRSRGQKIFHPIKLHDILCL